MDRREFLCAVAASAVVTVDPASAKGSDFAALLSRLQSASIDTILNAKQFREPTVTRGVGHGTPSRRKLSKSASELIIACEVASPAIYDRRWRRPVWPRGQSGVTIGVGYDLRFANRESLNRDWPMLSKADRDLLARALTRHGEDAHRLIPLMHAVDVPWTAAQQQFFAFLPYPTRETEVAFPNTSYLHDDSFGALVSLIYNRGSRISQNSTKRREMYEIQQLMAERQFGDIPRLIRAMKRIWRGDPNATGLLLRRDAEAALFERGLAA